MQRLQFLTIFGFGWAMVAGIVIMLISRRIAHGYARIRDGKIDGQLGETRYGAGFLWLGITFMVGGATGVMALLVPAASVVVIVVGVLVFLVAICRTFSLFFRVR